MTALFLALTVFACTCNDPATDAPGAESTSKQEPAEPELPPVAPARPARHARIIVIDTLRADALAGADTPNIDALAASGDSVPRAWSSGTWTVPSVVSLLSGAPIRQHGWNQPSARLGHYPPIPELPTLPTVLQAAGFGTQGLYANPYLAEELGFDRGFDDWKRISDKVAAKRLKKVVDETWGDGGRHFVYLHMLGPHSPLRPSEAAAAKYQVDPRWTAPKIGFEVGVAKRNREEGAREAYQEVVRRFAGTTAAAVAEDRLADLR